MNVYLADSWGDLMCCPGFIAVTGAHRTGYKLAGVLLAT